MSRNLRQRPVKHTQRRRVRLRLRRRPLDTFRKLHQRSRKPLNRRRYPRKVRLHSRRSIRRQLPIHSRNARKQGLREVVDLIQYSGQSS